mgnify:CR=1 FL=1
MNRPRRLPYLIVAALAVLAARAMQGLMAVPDGMMAGEGGRPR